MPLNLFNLAHKEGIIVDWFPFRHPLLGYYWYSRDNEQPVIGLNEEIQHDSRTVRSILAEELGHYYTSIGDSTPKHYYRYSDRIHITKSKEKALRWAVDQLIPLDELHEAHRKGITTSWDLANHFDVMEETIHFRLKVAQLKGELKSLIKYICDHCTKEVDSCNFPESWVKMIDQMPCGFQERHFCSWSCLRDYRQTEALLSKQKVII